MANDYSTQKNVTAEDADKQLVFELIESMYAGIALMAQAQHKTVAPEVLKLAEKLQKDHTKLTEELKMYASDKGWLIPTGEKKEDMEKREEMLNKNGEEYQQEWLALLRERHETNIEKLENADPADPKLKKMGVNGLSKLKDLLNGIIDVQDSVE